MYQRNFDLDISPHKIPVWIRVSQYDDRAEIIHVTLKPFNDASVLTIPFGAKASIRGTKPDGNGFDYDAVLKNNVVTFTVTEQMTAVAGKVVCEIMVYKGTPATDVEPASDDYMQICTANFILFVEKAALDKDTLKSDSEIRQLVNVVDRTDELLAAARKIDEDREEIDRDSTNCN